MSAAELSRVARQPIKINDKIKVELKSSNKFNELVVSGAKGNNKLRIPKTITLEISDNVITVVSNDPNHPGMAGTMRALINNMVVGVDKGFVKKLLLEGVGYKAQLSGNTLNLALGFSHPVKHIVPEGVKAQLPSATEIVLESADKQLLGQVAAEIRAYRPPDAYKGKGVRYEGEELNLKDVEKK